MSKVTDSCLPFLSRFFFYYFQGFFLLSSRHFVVDFIDLFQVITLFLFFSSLELVVKSSRYLVLLCVPQEVRLRQRALHAADGLLLSPVFLLESVSSQQLVLILLELRQFFVVCADERIFELQIRICRKLLPDSFENDTVLDLLLFLASIVCTPSTASLGRLCS